MANISQPKGIDRQTKKWENILDKNMNTPLDNHKKQQKKNKEGAFLIFTSIS